MVAKGFAMTDRKTDKEGEPMRSKKIVVISVLIGSLLFPLSLGADVAGPPGTVDAIPEEEVRQFIDKYVDRYKAHGYRSFHGTLFEKRR